MDDHDFETESTRGEALRQGIGEAGMRVMEAADDDLAPIMETFTEHVLLMHRELQERGLDPCHAAQVVTSFTVGVMFRTAIS